MRKFRKGELLQKKDNRTIKAWFRCYVMDDRYIQVQFGGDLRIEWSNPDNWESVEEWCKRQN